MVLQRFCTPDPPSNPPLSKTLHMENQNAYFFLPPKGRHEDDGHYPTVSNSKRNGLHCVSQATKQNTALAVNIFGNEAKGICCEQKC